MIDSIKFKQLGVRVCIWCLNNYGVETQVFLDLEDTRALGREVRVCYHCGLMSIGEKVPPSLKKFFDDLPPEVQLAA